MHWVNLIMDSFGSFALATEPTNEKVLDRDPYKRREYPVSIKIWKHIILQSAVQLGILQLLYLLAPQFIKEHEPSRMICFSFDSGNI